MVQKAYQAQTRFLIDIMYTVCLVKMGSQICSQLLASPQDLSLSKHHMQATVTVPLLLEHYMYIPKIGHTGRGPILSGMGTPGIWLKRSNMYCTLVMAASSADKESIVSARLVSRWSLCPTALGSKICLLYMPSLSQSSFGKVWTSELFSSSCCSMSSRIPAAAGLSWAECHMHCPSNQKKHPAVT